VAFFFYLIFLFLLFFFLLSVVSLKFRELIILFICYLLLIYSFLLSITSSSIERYHCTNLFDKMEQQLQDSQQEAQTVDQMEQLRAHVSKMEEESAKLQEMQDEMMIDENVPEQDTAIEGEGEGEGEESNKHLSIQERQEIDNRSIYVGNIDYAAAPEEVQELFKDCGTINRITILTNKMTGVPLGYGFVEFESQESIPKALELDQSLFKGRPLKVILKRTNVPGFGRGRGRGRGGFRGGRGGRGGFIRGGRGGRGGYGNRGRGGFSRGRGNFQRGGRGGFAPY
jgi:polyadenylate-binding protein 2